MFAAALRMARALVWTVVSWPGPRLRKVKTKKWKESVERVWVRAWSLAVYPTVPPQRNCAVHGCVQKAVTRRFRVIESASRERRFPECPCCEGEEVNRQ